MIQNNDDADALKAIVIAYRQGYVVDDIVEQVSARWEMAGNLVLEAPKHWPLENCPLPPEIIKEWEKLILDLSHNRNY